MREGIHSYEGGEQDYRYTVCTQRRRSFSGILTVPCGHGMLPPFIACHNSVDFPLVLPDGSHLCPSHVDPDLEREHLLGRLSERMVHGNG